MNIAKEVFKSRKLAVAFPLNQDTAEENRIPIVSYDYGLNLASEVLKSNDFGWKIKPFKRVTLVNVQQCIGRVSVMGLTTVWRGTGHLEWEYLLATFFISSILEAYGRGEEEADITDLFNRDYTARGGLVFKQDDVFEHIIGWFDIVDENEHELRVALRI